MTTFLYQSWYQVKITDIKFKTTNTSDLQNDTMFVNLQR